MAAGRIQHWKHGWIPITPEAKAFVARGGKGPRPGQRLAQSMSVVAGRNRADDLSDSLVWQREMGKIGLPVDRGGRKKIYSPEAEGTAARLLNEYRAIEPKVTPQLVRTAGANGGHMLGLENRLKTQESLARKLEEKSVKKGLTIQAYGGQIGDALRYTMIAPPEGYGDATQSTIDSFRAQGYKVEVENTWKPGAVYKGVNTNLSKDGLTFEVQFHTEDSFRAKEQQHGLYDIARDASTPPEKAAEVTKLMLANMASLADPAGAATVH